MKIKIILMICMLFLLVGCNSKGIKQESFSNLDDAMEIRFNESIHKVTKCSISIYSGEEYLSFAIFGDCDVIKNECQEDICDWSVSGGDSCEKGKCYPNFTGRCICRFTPTQQQITEEMTEKVLNSIKSLEQELIELSVQSERLVKENSILEFERDYFKEKFSQFQQEN